LDSGRGKGTRLKSSLAKVLHAPVDERSSNKSARLRAAEGARDGGRRRHQRNRSRQWSSHWGSFVLQQPQNGTGHAMQVRSAR